MTPIRCLDDSDPLSRKLIAPFDSPSNKKDENRVKGSQTVAREERRRKKETVGNIVSI